MRLFVTKPCASHLVGAIAIEPLADVSAIEASELAESHLNDSTLALLFDRLAREATVEPPTEPANAPSAEDPSDEAQSVRTVRRTIEQVARVTANNRRLVRELEGAARRLNLRGVRR